MITRMLRAIMNSSQLASKVLVTYRRRQKQGHLVPLHTNPLLNVSASHPWSHRVAPTRDFMRSHVPQDKNKPILRRIWPAA